MWQLPSYPRSYDGDSNNNDSDYGSNQSAGWDAYDDGAMPKLERAFGATGQLVRGGVNRTKGWSELAKKYSHPLGYFGKQNHRLLKGTGKSGITPLSPFFERPDVQKLKLHYHQRNRFQGFSAAELDEMEALAALQMGEVKSQLINPIHKLFDKASWETAESMGATRAPIPIRGDHPGYWLAENPVVWKAMEPALRLASLAVTNAHLSPWWNALFFGDYKSVESVRLPPFHKNKKNLQTFHTPRKPQSVGVQEGNGMLAIFARIAKKMQLVFYSGYTEEETNLPKQRAWSYGQLSPHQFRDKFKIALAIETVQPLLRNDLTDAERICSWFLIADTLVHELAHGSWEYMRMEYPNELSPSEPEPYFEDERLPELGWSLENKMWKGSSRFLVTPMASRRGPGLPPLGLVKSNWFNQRNENYNQNPSFVVLRESEVAIGRPIDPFRIVEFWPVPTHWMHSLFQSNLWDLVVRQYGNDATAMGPLTRGTQISTDVPTILSNYEYLDNLTAGLRHSPIRIKRITTPAEEWENARRIKADNIRAALADRLTWEGSNNPGDSSNGDNSAEDTSDNDSQYSDSYDDDYKNPQCPRWEDITQYLFNNRGPNELALDTMTFDIAEPNLYKYILDRGGLDITAEEFRSFLAMANKREELFRWVPFPGVGTVTRIETGWPPALDYIIPQGNLPDEVAIKNFNFLINQPYTHDALYIEFGEYRDLDYEQLRLFLNWVGDTTIDIEAQEIENCIIEHARGPHPYVTLGPKGVVRCIFPIDDDTRNRYGTEYIRNKVKYNEAMAKKDEEMRKARGSSGQSIDDIVYQSILDTAMDIDTGEFDSQLSQYDSDMDMDNDS